MDDVRTECETKYGGKVERIVVERDSQVGMTSITVETTADHFLRVKYTYNLILLTWLKRQSTVLMAVGLAGVKLVQRIFPMRL